MQDHDSNMKTSSYTHNQRIHDQVHIVYTIHKHVQNIIILTTNKNIYKMKNGAPFPLPYQHQILNFSRNSLCSSTSIPSQVQYLSTKFRSHSLLQYLQTNLEINP